MKQDEINKLEAFFKKRFKFENCELRAIANKTDTAEFYIDDEFIGLIYRDDEDGDLSYQFNMAILDIDLEA